MKAWFESLQSREKRFVAAAAVVLALAIFWLAVWAPLERGRQNAAENVASWQAAVKELRSLQGALRGSDSGGAPAALNQSLVVIVDTTLRSRNLYSALQRSTPRQNGIVVELDNAAFDDLVLWLGDMSEQYNLRVPNASFTPSAGAAGRVNGSVTLER